MKYGGTIVEVEAVKEFNGYCYIIANIIRKGNLKHSCAASRLPNDIALVVRDKSKLEKIGLNKEERRVIYCHEIGHVFSNNQLKRTERGKIRNIDDEIDSDTFAVKKCDCSPVTLKRALEKTLEYELNNIEEGVTVEQLNRFKNEMSIRIQNAQRMIDEKNKEKTKED